MSVSTTPQRMSVKCGIKLHTFDDNFLCMLSLINVLNSYHDLFQITCQFYRVSDCSHTKVVQAYNPVFDLIQYGIILLHKNIRSVSFRFYKNSYRLYF